MTRATTMFEGFAADVIDVGEASVFVRHHAGGDPVLLLHGHPRTSATWHVVAPRLVRAGFAVVCPDLRGYGRSTAPAPRADHSGASKRAMAQDMVTVMRELGHSRFHVVGHDRGSYVAFRLALDHPETVDRLVVLDGIPIVEHLERADARFATAWWHWFFFAQPGIPERVIGLDPRGWYTAKATAGTMGAENHAELMAAVEDPATVRAMLEDYRAGLTVDRHDEEASRAAGARITSPLLVLWSARDDLEELHGDPREIWHAWADDVAGEPIDSGHHVAEEAPDDLVDALLRFLPAPVSSP